jgi:AcrR family transcriptional regulator
MQVAEPEPEQQPTFRRSAGSPKGQLRRTALLDLVTEDLAENGLVDFSLRRAARAAGTTHKVLLYYFQDVDDLLAQALLRLREQRVGNAMHAVAAARPAGSLAQRVRAIWPILEADASGLRVIDQAIGLAMYDPARYAHLSVEAAEQYLPSLLSLLPPEWAEQRRREVADLLLATFRGFLMDWRTTGDASRIRSALEALARAMDREEADGP